MKQPVPPRQTGLTGNSDQQLEVKGFACFQNTKILKGFLLAVNKYVNFFQPFDKQPIYMLPGFKLAPEPEF